MTEYTKNLSEPWFSLIKLGIKKCEGRLRKGDYIIFQNNDFGFYRSCKVRITSVKSYDTFTTYLEKETLVKTLPGIDNIEEGKEIYYKYYSKEDEEKYKIVAIRLK
jgi:ASC-1-like (ASCH) protein